MSRFAGKETQILVVYIFLCPQFSHCYFLDVTCKYLLTHFGRGFRSMQKVVSAQCFKVVFNVGQIKIMHVKLLTFKISSFVLSILLQKVTARL